MREGTVPPPNPSRSWLYIHDDAAYIPNVHKAWGVLDCLPAYLHNTELKAPAPFFFFLLYFDSYISHASSTLCHTRPSPRGRTHTHQLSFSPSVRLPLPTSLLACLLAAFTKRFRDYVLLQYGMGWDGRLALNSIQFMSVVHKHLSSKANNSLSRT